MIALVDCESFYASCERAFRPDLKNRAIVVLSNNDHWIIALNKEAKALGLKRGLRFKEAASLIKEHNIVYFSSNYSLYNDMSLRVMETLREFSDDVEVYSIDEAFVSLQDGSPALAEEIRDRIFRQTRIPTSIGIGPTKSLAKIAQRLAKEEGGQLSLRTKDEIEKSLKRTSIDEVWGVGRAFAVKLQAAGIVTAHDFVELPEWEVNKMMTVVGWRLQRELKGIAMSDLKLEPPPRKGIISARQFGHPVKDLGIISEALSQYTETAVDKLRRQQCLCSLMSVSLESSVFRGTGHSTVARRFPPTDYLPFFIQTAKELLASLYQSGLSYWRTTIFLNEIIPKEGLNHDFFLPRQDKKKDSIMNTMDDINEKYGRSTIHILASQASDNWAMRREYLSPFYTSRLRDYPKLKAVI